MVYPAHSINLNILKVKGCSDLFFGLEVFKKVLLIVAMTSKHFSKSRPLCINFLEFNMETPKLPDVLRTEEEIIKSWKGDVTKPLVSVRCITYNHAPYIEDAIKGFLIQETDFPVEILIHDDASTDGTRQIVESYHKKYPRIIKTILQDENQYSKGNKPGRIILGKSTGIYLAICEGDDYWLDPHKLQKQVSYLEEHPWCVITGHDAFVIDDEERILSRSKLSDSQKKDFSAREVAEGKAWILTMSWVYRNVVEEFAYERNMVVNNDTFFTSILGQYGGSHYHSDIKPAAYRVHAGGVWSSASKDAKIDDEINTWFWMYRYYKRKGKYHLANIYYSRFLCGAFLKGSYFQLGKALVMKAIKARELKGVCKACLGRGNVYRIKKIFDRI